MTPTPRVWRVEWWAGFGWPDVKYREHTARTYFSAERVHAMVDEILRLPSHHELIGVYSGVVDWEDVTEEFAP